MSQQKTYFSTYIYLPPSEESFPHSFRPPGFDCPATPTPCAQRTCTCLNDRATEARRHCARSPVRMRMVTLCCSCGDRLRISSLTDSIAHVQRAQRTDHSPRVSFGLSKTTPLLNELRRSLTHAIDNNLHNGVFTNALLHHVSLWFENQGVRLVDACRCSHRRLV